MKLTSGAQFELHDQKRLLLEKQLADAFEASIYRDNLKLYSFQISETELQHYLVVESVEKKCHICDEMIMNDHSDFYYMRLEHRRFFHKDCLEKALLEKIEAKGITDDEARRQELDKMLWEHYLLYEKGH